MVKLMFDENENYSFKKDIGGFSAINFPEKENLKSISIRGVNAGVYEQFVTKTKVLNMNIGDAISKLMKDVVNSFEDGFPHISAKSLGSITKIPLSIIGHEDLTITKQDLVDAKNQISLINITRLSFAPDVDKETFQQYISKIIGCTNIKVPNVLPKLVLLSKLQACKNIEIYEVD